MGRAIEDGEEFRDIESEEVGHGENDLHTPLLKRRGTFRGSMIDGTSQLAIVGANVSPVESLDYEIIENDLFKHDWRSRSRVQIFQYIVLKWTLAFLIGIFTGLVGFFNNLAVENIAGMKFVITSNYMLEKRYMLAFAVFGSSNLVLALLSALLCAYIAPAAAGSGIPEVKAYLNGVDAPAILAPGTLFVKIFGSIGAVSASLHVGKEGPMVHTGACIASLLSQGGSRRYHLTWRWLRYFKNDRDRRDLVTCGAAAGVAAAFRAPVGGVLFALEEAASWWRSALLWRTFFTTAVVAVVLRGLIDYCQTGHCGLFGKGGLIMFDVSSVTISYHISDLLPVIILGVFGGILGGLYNYLLDKILRVYSLINERGPLFKLILTCTVSIITSACAFGLPWLAKCIPCPEGLEESCPTIGRSGNFKKFQCEPGYYNDLASLFFNTNDDAIRNLFSSGTATEFHSSSILLFFGAVYVLGLLTYGIAVPSGLFIPVILAGATYGRLVGILMGSFTELDQGLFAVLGAASFLGGSMRMTVSLCVILLELTNNLLMLPLVMVVLLISKAVGDAFNSSIYDQIVHLKGLPFLEANAEPYMRHLTAGDVVTGPLVTFSGIEKVGNILRVLKSCTHNGFPVIDEPPFSEAPVLCGLVLRSHLVVLLKKKLFLPSQAFSSADFSQQFTYVEFAKPGSGKGIKLEEIEISADEEEMFVDLHPFTNTSPYTVVETMSLAKALMLFRQVGLRHLCVVPKSSGRPPIVGILTRHDFMAEHILGLFPNLKQRKRSKADRSTFPGIC
ncbi:hypothetical protein SUGI_0331050 [Cryptomeria japonica]|nr:hypothetical protein SUGI_0331050 [Cryptomeria japonica]